MSAHFLKAGVGLSEIELVYLARASCPSVSPVRGSLFDDRIHLSGIADPLSLIVNGGKVSVFR